MTENQYYKLAEQNYFRRNLAENNRETLEELIKFHQATTTIPSNNITNMNKQKDLWNPYLNEINSIPYFVENSYNLNINNIPKQESFPFAYDKSYKFKMKTLDNIFVNSFSDRNSNRYETKVNNPTTLPLLLIFKNNVVDGLSAGSYFIDFNSQKLLQIKNWESLEKEDVLLAFSSKGDLPSYTAIAYAIDMQKASYVHGKRGYRQALIEIGSLKQKFKETIEKLNINTILGEHGSSEFADNMASNLCGTNIRLSPIILIHWFGKVKKGENNVS